VRFVDDDEIEGGRRIEIQESLHPATLALLPEQEGFVE